MPNPVRPSVRASRILAVTVIALLVGVVGFVLDIPSLPGESDLESAADVPLAVLAPEVTVEEPTSTTTMVPVVIDGTDFEEPVTTTTTPPETSPKPSDARVAAPAPAPSPAPAPKPGGSFGAGSVGPGNEERTQNGVVADSLGAVESANSGEVVLLRGGSYNGNLRVPGGVTVKPFDGEGVTISGQVTMSSGSTLAGVQVNGSGQWAVRVDSSNVVVRNNDISGGSIETVRVSGNASGVLITGNALSGGGNHVIKVKGEGGRPSAEIKNNVIRNARSEDGIQTEDNGPVLIERNTIAGVPEDGIDVKSGDRVTISRNLFDGGSLGQSAILVHGSGYAVITGNRFVGTLVALGSRGGGDPRMTLASNVLDNTDISVRYSVKPVVIEGNHMSRGTLKLGQSGGDHPRDARVVGNTFDRTELLDRVTSAGDSWVCQGNALQGVQGNWSQCG